MAAATSRNTRPSGCSCSMAPAILNDVGPARGRDVERWQLFRPGSQEKLDCRGRWGPEAREGLGSCASFVE